MSILKFIFSKDFLKQAGFVLAVFVGLIMVVLWLLKVYTHHGEAVEVPDIKDITISEAIPLLNSRSLSYQVIDSMYIQKKKAGTVLEQIPLPGEKIKKGREVYVILSTNKAPLVQLPDLRDISYRNARSALTAMGFSVIHVERVTSRYKDLVIDVKSGGRDLLPGTKLSKETPLTLVVGTGFSDTETIPVPSLRGLSKSSAILQANNSHHSVRAVNYDVTPTSLEDEVNYIVYKQSPITGTPIQAGGKIDIWLTKNASLLNAPEEIFEEETSSRDIEKFF